LSREGKPSRNGALIKFVGRDRLKRFILASRTHETVKLIRTGESCEDLFLSTRPDHLVEGKGLFFVSRQDSNEDDWVASGGWINSAFGIGGGGMSLMSLLPLHSLYPRPDFPLSFGVDGSDNGVIRRFYSRAQAISSSMQACHVSSQVSEAFLLSSS
jgi:hypothetical protein